MPRRPPPTRRERRKRFLEKAAKDLRVDLILRAAAGWDDVDWLEVIAAAPRGPGSLVVARAAQLAAPFACAPERIWPRLNFCFTGPCSCARLKIGRCPRDPAEVLCSYRIAVDYHNDLWRRDLASIVPWLPRQVVDHVLFPMLLE